MDERHQPAPHIAFDPPKVDEFGRIWRIALASGGEIAYDSAHPKYEFLCWLGETHDIVLHGSNEMEIAEFIPLRMGFDANPHGNHRAIYATNDGIWPLFFAVLDRQRYRGSMRNGVMWVDGAGEEIDFTPDAARRGGRKVYLFSLNAEALPSRPWREAMIYILPRRTFEQLRDGDGRLIAEWASREPVRPLAKLRVAPGDFPFLERVHGHDDTAVLRTEDLLRRIIGGAREVEALSDGYAFSLPLEPGLREDAAELATWLRGFIAAARVQAIADVQGTTLRVEIRGPEALQDALKRRVHEHRSSR